MRTRRSGGRTYPIAQTKGRKKHDTHSGTWSLAEVWRREVVLVGDAAENPARSTAGKPQLRGLTTHRRGAHVPKRNPSEMAAFLQTACPMLLYTVSAQCVGVGVAGTLLRETETTSQLLLLRGGPTRLCSNGFVDGQCRMQQR